MFTLKLKELSSRYQGKVCFLGLINPQGILRTGSPDEVKRRVLYLIENIGTPKGGYICTPSTTILPDVPFENIRALFKTAGDYRYKRWVHDRELLQIGKEKVV